MSWQKALNEIQGLLTQGGTPANHAQDVVARLSYAMEDYYNYRQSQGNSQDLNAASGDSAAFKNAFRAKEENPLSGAPGADGKGAYAWASGADGKDGEGEDGSSGQDGTNGRNGTTVVTGGGSTDISKVPCKDLAKKLKDCKIKTGDCDCSSDMVCKAGYGGTGMLNGQNICAVVDSQARMLKEIRKKLDAIWKLMPPVDCP